jgi:hypothetical protein
MGEVVCISALCVSHSRPEDLLVEVHAEDVGPAEGARLGDHPGPAGVVAQDVAHDELAVEARRGLDHALGVFHGGRQRLLHEDMGARLHRRDGEVGMAVGIGGDDDEVGRRLHPRLEAVEAGIGASASGRSRGERLTSPTISDPALA